MTWVWKGLRRARALRAITPAWCWDNLNRFDNFGSFNKAVNKIGYFCWSTEAKTVVASAAETA